MSTIIIVQARMSSTRLPGKVMREIDAGTKKAPMLEFLLERLKLVENADKIVVACPDDEGTEIAKCAGRMGVSVFAGAHSDVLLRYAEAAATYQADVVVRVTADCPLIDPLVISEVIDIQHVHGLDYVSNVRPERTFPRGMDVECFTAKILSEAHMNARSGYESEHVTPWIVAAAILRESIGCLDLSVNASSIRLTVDEEDDFKVIDEVYRRLYPVNPRFDLSDILLALAADPDLALINQHVRQKEEEGSSQISLH